MTVLLISLVVVLILLLIILTVPVTLYVEKSQGKKLLIKIKFMFFSFENNEKTMNYISKLRKTKPKAQPQKSTNDDLPFKEKILNACSLISNVIRQVNYLLSHITIDHLYLKIICAEFDAAFTAISYGAICSAVYPLLGIIENKTKVKNGAFNLKIGCDYNSKKSLYDFNITLKLSLIFALIAGIRFLKNNKK